MKLIHFNKETAPLTEAVKKFKEAQFIMASTGAGISVPSGIPDFRSRGGLWTKYNPEIYANLDVFLKDPAKTWEMYRQTGRELQGKQPNKAHLALRELEKKNLLRGVVTQNIDRLHHAAGSETVLEIHGDFQHLQCLECGSLEAVKNAHFDAEPYPQCTLCQAALKPNIVLFGEAVRQMEAIETFIMQCDALLVVGTSAKVYPAAALPEMVKQKGGLLFEFNLEPVLEQADYCFPGNVAETLPLFVEALQL